MIEPTLSIPLLLDAPLPDSSPDLTITSSRTPTHTASWTVSSADAGPFRRTALAEADDTIWLVSTPLQPDQAGPSRQSLSEDLLSPDIPTIQTLAASSPTSPILSPRRSRPTNQRNLSYSGRPRNSSSASSILSPGGAGKRRTSAFSPPPSALQLPTTTLSSAVASAAPPDSHTHVGSIGDRNELREVLREQRERKDDSSTVGLGLGGIGRRGLTGVHGKDDHSEHSGAASPKSVVSTSTEGTARFGLFGRSSISTDGEKDKELREQMVEVQVEREMEKELREDIKEKEDLRVVEAAIERSPTPASLAVPEDRRQSEARTPKREVKRLILPNAGRGKIVALQVFEAVDALCILRDEGLLDVFSLATLRCTSSINLEAPEEQKSANGATFKNTLKVPPFWHWTNVHLAQNADIFMFVAHGLPWPCELPSPNGEVTRVVMVTPSPLASGSHIVARLELPGEGDIAVCRAKDASDLLHSTSTSLTSYPIIFPSAPASAHATPQLRASPQIRAVSSAFPNPYLRSTTPDPSHSREPSHHGLRRSASHTQLRDSATSPLLGSADSGEHDKGKEKEKGFAKFLAARRADWGRKGKDEEKHDEPLPGVGEGQEVERDGGGGWERIKVVNSHGVGWKDEALDVFSCDGKRLSVKGTITLSPSESVQDVLLTNGLRQVVVRTKGCTFVYQASAESRSEKGKNLSFSRVSQLDGVKSASLGTDGRLLVVRSDSVQTSDVSKAESQAERLLALSTPKESLITHICPSSVESVFIADRQGNVTSRQFGDLLTETSSQNAEQTSSDRLDSPVTFLSTVPKPDGTGSYTVAGDEDGSIRIWTTEPLKLCASFTLFADPVHTVTVLDMPQAGTLQGCLLVTSREGTVGIVSLKEMDDLFLIPASRTPLRRVFIESKDILLAYTNGKARVWNTQTQEFRRSTGLDAAEDMVGSGDWAEVQLGGKPDPSGLGSVVPNASNETALGRLLHFDLRELGRWLHSSKNNPHHSPLSALRNLLSIFLTFGVNESIDDICTSKLGVRSAKMPVVIGQSGDNGASELFCTQGTNAWTQSPATTGLRQLVIVALLRPFLDSPDHERWAAEVIAFYTASLPCNVVEPDLEFFAKYYMDSSSDVHQAARMLFAARVARMTKAELEVAVEVGQPDLPSRLTAATRFSDVAACALTLLGGIALHKYQSLQPSTLKSIAESVSLFLHESKSAHLPLAVEICSKGFTTWQSYVDPSDLLRRLFHLATHKDFASATSNGNGNGNGNSGGSSIAAQSRLAVLHVASTNPPLFMSTLSMDILDAKSAEGRNSIMKLCVFMARKKPAVLENGLPRIAEAVVKSLDPNVGKMRDDVWQAATVILNELVLAFSTIDFHSGTQRLAVGTHEGAVIMYDLKTASRLYVIEPHKHPVSAVTFSPDGRRLITVSLEQGDVTVWKVGSSLSGFFNVGAPPRQGGEKGEPFKRIEFIRADDGPLDSTSALSDIQISWPGPRQARVMIRETALTFET